MKAKSFLWCVIILVGSLGANAQWVQQDLGVNTPLLKIYFKNDSVGFIGGNDYRMFKTVDRGQTWNLQSLPTNTTQFQLPVIADINFPTEDIGYALPNLKSIDGGSTWDTMADVGFYLSGLYFIDELKGFTTDYKTDDGGITWEWIDLVPTASPRTDVLFINDSVGFITATYHSGIWKTIDGGDTWEVKDINNNIREITFASDSVGYTVGSSWEGVRKTIDQGETWVGLNAPNAIGLCISCPDKDTCYVSSTDGIMKTVDGGQNWFVQDSTVKNINSIYCFDGSSCIAVGGSGKVYKTTNGGGLVSVQEIPIKETELLIYPNPTSGEFVFEIGVAESKEILLKIVNMQGQEVFTEIIEPLSGNYRKEMDISHHGKGIFLLQVITLQSRLSRRIMVD